MLRRKILPFAMLALLPMMAGAHPHEFVDTGLTFNFDDQGRLATVGVVWLYDDLTSLLILEDLGMDQDGDGSLDAAEEARLTELAGNWPEDFDGNLTLSADGVALGLSGPLEAKSGLRNGRVYMTFLRALTERPDPAAVSLALQVYDPSYYTFYDLVGQPGILGREDCNLRIEPADISLAQRLYDEALAQLSEEELLEQGRYPELGGVFADVVRLECASGS